MRALAIVSGDLPLTVVTPSLKQGRYIQATIESVLSQQHPRIEYFVVDGGSTDETLDLLASADSTVRWTSEHDDGQNVPEQARKDMRTHELAGEPDRGTARNYEDKRWRVSIITPSFNQAPFIRDTLAAVAHQDYPDIEHVVVDGCSTDGTIDILREWGGRWISEPDEGQADAINKGVALTSGEIVAWLNSDDVYLAPNAVSRVVRLFDEGAQVVTAGGCYLNPDGSRHRKGTISVFPTRLALDRLMIADYVLQPATFWSRNLAEELPLDTTMHFAFDWDLFIRMRQRAAFVPLDAEIAGYRLHGAGKTISGGTERQVELLRMIERYHGRRSFTYRHLAVQNLGWSLSDRLPGPARRLAQRLLWAYPRVLNRLTDGRGSPG